MDDKAKIELLEKEKRELTSALDSTQKKLMHFQGAAIELQKLRAFTNDIANAFSYVLEMNSSGILHISKEQLESMRGNKNFHLMVGMTDDQKTFIFETRRHQESPETSGKHIVATGEPLIVLASK